MYNKLILENIDEEFEIKFDGNFHTVPNGKFEAEETLGNFIIGQSRKWWIKVNKLTQAEKPSVKKIEPVINEISDDEIVDDVEVDTKTDTKEDKKEEKKFGYKL